MKLAKRIAIFLVIGLVTFALGVLITPVKPPKFFPPGLVLVVKTSPWKMLLSFENRDLRLLDSPSKRMVEGAVATLTAKRHEDPAGHFEPALFRSMANSKNEKRYVLVEVSPLVMIPGSTRLRVHVFDTTGRLLNVQEFSAGYRTSVTGMHIRDDAILERSLLIVNAEYCLGGHPSTQYYALANDNLALVYLEQDGKPDQNNYQDSHMTIGPEVQRLLDEWANALNSADDAEVLSALVWLNGYHADLPLKSRAGLQKRIKELSQSENHWIGAAAQAVLEKQ